MLKTAVIGSGGAGKNMLHSLSGSGIPLYLMNSTKDPEFRDIFSSRSEILASISSDPSVKRGLMETERAAYSVIEQYDVIFSVSGLGGFYGTAVPIMLTRLSKKVIPLFTIPFSIEGERRMRNSRKGMENIMSSCRWALVLENDKLLKIAPNATLEGAFRGMNLLISSVIIELTEAFHEPEEVLNALRGTVGAGLGSGYGMNRQEKALRDALSSPWLQVSGKTLLIMKGGGHEDFLWIRERLGDIGAEMTAEFHIEGGEKIELLILS